MKGTSWSQGLSVTADGDGVVPLAGAVAVRLLADRVGLTQRLSTALSRRWFFPVHDRGQVWVDVATMLTTRGEHRGNIHPHPTPIMDRREPPPRQSCRQPLGEADSIRQQTDRQGPSQRHHAITISGD